MQTLFHNFKVKQAHKRLELERQWAQEICTHNLRALGESREMYWAGIDADFRSVYSAYCPKCDKTFRYGRQTELDEAIQKQKFRAELAKEESQ